MSLGSPCTNRPIRSIRASRAQKITRDLTREKREKIFILFKLHCNKQLHVSECFSQLKKTYDASKEASNQQLYVRMLGSSIKLSLLSRRTSKVRQENSCVKNTKIAPNRAKTDVFTHACHVRHVIAREHPIGMKRKRSSKYSTAHGLSNDTNYIWLTSLDIILPYLY